jgi:hypothetical protein
MQGSKHLDAASIVLVLKFRGKAFSTILGRYSKQISEQFAPGVAVAPVFPGGLVQE